MTLIEWKLRSTTKYGVWHTLQVDTNKKAVYCTCNGYLFHGRCKHIRFYKKLIKALLHETPGVEREKGGK